MREALTLTVVHLLPARAPRTAYAVHQAVAACARGERVLWARPSPGVLAIQSEGLPDWARVPGAQSAIARPVPALPAGAAVSWMLIGNPVVSVGRTRPDGSLSDRPGQRRLDGDARHAWPRPRLTPALTLGDYSGQELGPARGRGITLTRHLYTGTATITDAAAAAALVRDGVGRGKGFGCGLLILNPLEVAR